MRYTHTDKEGNNWSVKFLAAQIKSDLTLLRGGFASEGEFGDLIEKKPTYAIESDGPSFSLSFAHERQFFRAWVGASTFRLKNDHEALESLRNGLDTFAQQKIPVLIPFPPFFTLIDNPFAAEAQNLSRAWEVKGKRVSYANIGFAYDEKWMIQGELSKLFSQAAPFQTKQAYLSIAYHLGEFTPYVVGTFKRAPKRYQKEGNWGALGQEAGASQNYVVSSLNSALGDNRNDYTAGVRWDFHSNAAVNLQWTRAHYNDSWSAGANVTSGVSKKSDFVSATIDFVF